MYKKLVCTLAVAVALVLTVQAQTPVDYTLQASDVTVENGVITGCSYDFSANTDGTNLIIPEALGVTGIADGDEDWMGYISGSAVFAEKNIKSVHLPSTLEYLGDYAFRENALTKISIPGSVAYIGRDAFYTNDIDSVFIPNSVCSIGANAFYSNENLDTVVFEDGGHLIKIGSHAFVYTAVTTIKLPTPIVPQDNFEYWIKFDTDRTHYQGGETVSPGNYEFLAKFDYTLTDDDVVVANGVIESCSYNFNSKFIIIPDELDGQAITGIAGSTSQKGGIFYGKTLMELTLPSSLETIGKFSFNSNSIDTLIIPANVETIENYAFWGFSLDTVIFEANCKISTIGYAAFDNNTNLKMYFPAPVKENYEFVNWEDGDENTFNGGEQVMEFTASYSANFSLLPGSPVISLSGDMSFGDVGEQIPSASVLTVTNSGNATLSVSNIVLPEGFSADWDSGEIAVDGEQEIEITFLPTETKSYTGYIKVASNANLGTDSILVEGTGTASPVISLSGDIGFTDIEVGTEATDILTINNTGSAQLNVSSIDLPSGFTADWNSGAIGAGSKQDLTITFSPKENKTYTGVVTINSDAGAGTSSINISGTVVSIARVSLSGDLDFGDVGINASKNKTLTINNTGSEILEVAKIQLPDGFSAYPSSCNIETGKSQEITITFSPTEITPYSGMLTVISNAGDNNNTILVSGAGVAGSSLENTGTDIALDIFPNPASGTIHLKGGELYQVELISISGNVVLQQQMDKLSTSMDLSALPNGLYLVKAINKEGQASFQKIIKN